MFIKLSIVFMGKSGPYGRGWSDLIEMLPALIVAWLLIIGMII